MHLSSRNGSRGEAKCYRRDGWQSVWNFHSQPQEIWAESQSRVEDTGAHSEENSTEMTAVVPLQTATGTKTPAWWSLVQKLQPDDLSKRLAFCEDLLSRMETDQCLSERVIFSDEATFFLSGKVNRHNTRIWGSQNPHALIEMERDSPKVNMFCALSRRCVFGPFFFVEDSVTEKVYLDMLENWLMPQVTDEEVQGYIYQQDGAPPLLHKEVREYLNSRSVGWSCSGHRQHLLKLATPVTRPDSVWFLCVGFHPGQCLCPPLPKTLPELRERINTTIGYVTQDMLERVWQEWEYRLDICRVTRGAHIECI